MMGEILIAVAFGLASVFGFVLMFSLIFVVLWILVIADEWRMIRKAHETGKVSRVEWRQRCRKLFYLFVCLAVFSLSSMVWAWAMLDCHLKWAIFLFTPSLLLTLLSSFAVNRALKSIVDRYYLIFPEPPKAAPGERVVMVRDVESM